jgi:hypothetical protein
VSVHAGSTARPGVAEWELGEKRAELRACNQPWQGWLVGVWSVEETWGARQSLIRPTDAVRAAR